MIICRLHDLTGSTAMITGGAQGIGAAVALGLAHNGADIILAGRWEAWGTGARRGLQGRGWKLACRQTSGGMT